MKGFKAGIIFFLFFTCIITLKINAYGENKKWRDEAKISFIDTGGNTDVVSLSFTNLLNYTFSKRFEGALKLGALYGENEGEKNSENYQAEARLDSLFTKKFYASIITGWLKDKFAGIDSRYYIGPALGYKFLIGPKQYFKSEAKLDYVMEEYVSALNSPEPDDSDYVRGGVLGQYEYHFSEKNKFSQSIEWLNDFDNSDNYNVNSVSALISAINNFASLQTSYEIKYDHVPIPSTLEKTDTILSLTLVLNY